MPRVVVHKPHLSFSNIIQEVSRILKTLPFADEISVSCTDTASINLKDEGQQTPFICVHSVDQQRLNAIGEAFKNLPYEIQLIKTTGYKPANSTEVRWY